MVFNVHSQTTSGYGDEKELMVRCRIMAHPSCVCLKGEINLRHSLQASVVLVETQRQMSLSVVFVIPGHGHSTTPLEKEGPNSLWKAAVS